MQRRVTSEYLCVLRRGALEVVERFGFSSLDQRITSQNIVADTHRPSLGQGTVLPR